MKKILDIVRKNIVQFLLAVIFILVGIILYFYFSTKPNCSYYIIDHWSIWLEPYASFALIIIAIFIWYNEQKAGWRDSLPKRLDVSFWVKNVEIMNCKNAVLINESDIRAWGQQIGAQMGNTIHLSFELRFEITNKGIQNKNGIKYVLFELKMFLKVPPETMGLKKNNFDKTSTLYWEFNEDGVLEEKCFKPHYQQWPEEIKLPESGENLKKNLLSIINDISDLEKIKTILVNDDNLSKLFECEIEMKRKKLFNVKNEMNGNNV